jgi:hypothetical protein
LSSAFSLELGWNTTGRKPQFPSPHTLRRLQLPEGEITDKAVMKSTLRKFTLAIHPDKHFGSVTGVEHRKKVVLYTQFVAFINAFNVPIK